MDLFVAIVCFVVKMLALTGRPNGKPMPPESFDQFRRNSATHPPGPALHTSTNQQIAQTAERNHQRLRFEGFYE